MSQPLSEEAKILAAGYVLGDLTPEEEVLFQQMLQNNPDLLAEISALETTFQLLPHALPKVEPSSQLETKIMANLAATTIVAEKSQRLSLSSLGGKVVAISCLILVIFLAIDNFRLRRQLRLAQQIDPNEVATILQKSSSRLIALKGEGNLSAEGTLLFTPGRWEEIVVSLGDLPPLPPEQIYRMWLSLANGEIIYCGEFNTNQENSVFITLNPSQTPPKGVKATGIFVTIGSVDESPTPTGERVILGAI